jgi:hypothetical protein
VLQTVNNESCSVGRVFTKPAGVAVAVGRKDSTHPATALDCGDESILFDLNVGRTGV